MQNDFIQKSNNLNSISGWILTEGKWYPTEEWWHLKAIYDLQDDGYPKLQSNETKKILLDGDEMKIRDHLASLGFIKISRSQIDGDTLNHQQLLTLKNLLTFCNPEDEVCFLRKDGSLKFKTVSRILKLKNPLLLFDFN